MRASIKNWFPYFLFGGILLNATGLFIDILEPDSALYAYIAKHIALTNDWVNLFGDGHDWLDKPHLPFWLSALSYKCFGITAFAYKLPAFICWLLGVLYTYKLASAIYDENTARLSVITYISALHTILSNFDVRAEAFLTAFIVAAVYHIYKAMSGKWHLHILMAALYCALAVMTKGIFVLVTIASGFIFYWIYTKQFKQLLQLKWWLLAVLTLLFITPELYCLYLQFDMHPEKIVFGQTNVSGIKFFFWDSQFGRFFNNGPIKGSGDIFFFLHTFLWAFLPWPLITCLAVFAFFRKLRNSINKEWLIIVGGLLFTFIMFSVSKFQLPHYIVIIFPQFAIVTADYLLSIRSSRVMKRFNITQAAVYIIAVVFVLGTTYIYGIPNWYIPLLFTVIVTAIFIFIFKRNDLAALAGKNACFSVLVFLFLNIQFYPSLMQYQAGMLAGKWLNKNDTANTAIMYRCSSYSFEFYTNAMVVRGNSLDSLPAFIHKNKTVTLFLPATEMEQLKKEGTDIKIIQQFSYFHVSQLTWKFIQQSTRKNELETYLLAEFTIKP